MRGPSWRSGRVRTTRAGSSWRWRRFQLGASAFGAECPAPCFFVEGAAALRSFGRDLSAALGESTFGALGDVLAQELASGPPRQLEFSGGRCACGRSSPALARRGQCIRADRELE